MCRSRVVDYLVLEFWGLFTAMLLVCNQSFGGIIDNFFKGDALGLATEFQSKAQVTRVYEERAIPFPDFPPTFHSSAWTKGDWTDDTDQVSWEPIVVYEY